MQLSGPQIKQLQQAILKGFDSASLKQLVLFELNEDLGSIVESGPFTDVAFNLIGWANRTGQVELLIRAVQDARPANGELQQIVKQLLRSIATPVAKPVVTPETPQPPVPSAPVKLVPGRDNTAVYISYAWGNEGVDMVDRVYQSLLSDGYDVRRDKHNLSYKGSITEFEQEVGRAACIVVVVSDKSLRSPHCMFELLEIHRNQNFRERVCPIVLADAKIHTLAERLVYVGHWKGEYQRLEEMIKSVGIDVLSADGSFREYQKIRSISQSADELVTTLGDMFAASTNRLESDDFELLKNAIEQQIRRLSKN
ncbi:MAG: toll/interleukin-1 receptor domain-containing protein [Planctomycetaceae bacterium]|nr:MAG: toll/interleukin-1 receptor domain-containing protein [Planctomycetaceae bacterium]